MIYNFDEVINRRNHPNSYSMKWSKSPVVKAMLNVDTIDDDTISIFTADMDFRCAQPIIDAMHAVADHGIFGYSGHFSSPEYYHAIISWFARRHNWMINPEEIVYCHGTVEALKLLTLVFTNEGDGIIIQRPVYGPFGMVIEKTGRQLINNQLILGEDGYYTIDFEDLEMKAKQPNTKMIFICNPHNPVGRIWTDDELKRMAKICQDNNVLMVADEIHGDLIRKEATFHPMATLVDNSNLITCTAVNKTFNLAGLGCTNLVIPNKQIREAFVNATGLMLPSPFGIAAVIAAYTEGEEWLTQVNDYIDDNIDFVLDFLSKKMPKVKCRRPDGTYIMWMDFSDYGLSQEEVRKKICKDANVLLESEYMFDPQGRVGFERICVPSPRPVLEEALNRIYDQFKDLN